MRVHLVDGTYELFRAFFGAPSSRNAAGREVGAARALAGMVLKLLREPGVTHVGWAFDHVIESFRNRLFAGYKTGEGLDPDLLGQFQLAEDVCTALGVVTWSMVEFEADDAMATAARVAAEDPRVEQVLLCSPDKDLAQCVRDDRVILCDRMRQKTLDSAGVVTKFGVPPSAIPDYLALVGDTADGIPGVNGWGPKSAAVVLSAYGTLEAIPDDDAAWTVKPRGAPALARALAASRDVVRLYKELATLRVDVPVGTTVDDLEWKGADAARCEAVGRELDDPTLFERARDLRAARGAR